MCSKESGLHAQNLRIFLGLIVNIILGGGLYNHVMSMKFFIHFDNEYNIYMSSKNYEESGYGLDLDMQTISYLLCVAYSKTSGLFGETYLLRHVYLINTPHVLLGLFLKVIQDHIVVFNSGQPTPKCMVGGPL